MKAGSCTWHANQALAHAAELVQEGKAAITKLGLLLVGKIASFGQECFVNDRKLAAGIVQNNGKAPHPGSVARVRRSLARQHVLNCRRIHAGQKISPKHGDWTSSHGCVRSRLNTKLGFRVVERHQSTAPENAKPRPRFGAQAALTQPPPRASAARVDLLNMFEQIAAPAVAAAERRELAREAAQDAAMLATVPRARGQPP